MRPIVLSIKAFGPFSNEQIIDFSLLHDRRLFLIHGPTGAGKTSILDALCFALYGVTSISDRSLMTIRSHHADPSVQTEVTLTFALGATVYRVTRIPEQDRPKSRGSGITRKTASATLEQQNGTSEAPCWSIIADKWNRVNEKIESILGFRSDQFRQVVLLPQGEFRKLLSSSSQERQQILATLFKTGWYRHIEETLKDKAKAIYNEFELLKKQIQMILDDCSCESIDLLAEKITIAESTCLEMERQREQLAIKEREYQKLLNDALAVNEKFSTRSTAEREYTILEAQKAGIDQLTTQCERFENALAIEKTYEQLNHARKEFLSVQNRYTTAQEALIHAKNDLQYAEQEFSQISTIEHRREESRARLEYLSLILPKVQEYTSVAQRCTEHTRTHEALKTKLQQGKVHLEKVKTALKKLKEQSVSLQEVASQHDRLSNEYKTVEQRCLLEKSKAKSRQHLSETSENRINAEKEYKQSSDDVDLAKGTLDQLEQLVYEVRAALLAITLQDNAPCPVCGSTHHPAPTCSDKPLPDEKKVRQLKEELKKKEAERDQKKKRLESVERTLAEYTKELSLLIEQSGDSGEINLEEYNRKLEHVRALVKKAQDAEGKLNSTRLDIERGETALVNAEQTVTSLTEQYTESVSLFSSVETRLKTLESELPLSLREITSVTGEKSRINNEIDEFDKTIRVLRSVLEEAGKKVASLSASNEVLFQQMTDQKALLDTLLVNFTRELNKHRFSDEKDFLAHLRNSTEVASMRQTIHDFALALHAAQDRKVRALKECEGLHLPDLALLEKSLISVKDESIALINTLAAEHHQKSRFINRFNECKAIAKKITLCESDYAVIGQLAEISSGSNQLRITFERFILSTLLDDVLYAGTLRLAVMSRNRYTLHRARTHNDQRTAGGLDLMVFDTYTGTSRPVNSLSGGESFLAALSLALGLADVVQSYSGGIHLDTLFIDEGFGSLDSESLDCAFQALTCLGRDGRLVGIISHVPELKERIETRIELCSERNGSSVQIRI